jgi:hypothetical protein
MWAITHAYSLHQALDKSSIVSRIAAEVTVIERTVCANPNKLPGEGEFPSQVDVLFDLWEQLTQRSFFCVNTQEGE